ncbi:uncharacterized protein EDB91DRAFT_1112584 [Suillus paluster]|uniref:uncharacterized protein n=1 Tax=Suillus paluster TaxID=48578 RepID=UPI001B85EE9D|nr:uncharacterized protein EDB91DRAFT_1112584 [Suillus paluster]KAG1749123.1 hypothetical protein EDB91DRAFT_1112584 [Suillus paluster]
MLCLPLLFRFLQPKISRASLILCCLTTIRTASRPPKLWGQTRNIVSGTDGSWEHAGGIAFKLTDLLLRRDAHMLRVQIRDPSASQIPVHDSVVTCHYS